MFKDLLEIIGILNDLAHTIAEVIYCVGLMAFYVLRFESLSIELKMILPGLLLLLCKKKGP